MCNINLLMKKISQNDLPFLEMASLQSFQNNDDGEGYLTPQYTKVSANKIFISQEDNIIGQPWIAMHERLTTHGTDEEYNIQPIRESNIILLHNGVLWNYYDQIKSDSRIMTENINSKIDEKVDTQKAIVDEFSKADGSKSILVFDRLTEKLYYYKNQDTAFFATYGDNNFFASTSLENVAMAARYYGWGKPKTIKSDTLFSVGKGQFKPIQKIQEAFSYDAQAWGGYDRIDRKYYGSGGYNRNELNNSVEKIPATDKEDGELDLNDKANDGNMWEDDIKRYEQRKEIIDILSSFDLDNYQIDQENGIVTASISNYKDTYELAEIAAETIGELGLATYIIPIESLYDWFGF